jgi:archaellum component FlaC
LLSATAVASVEYYRQVRKAQKEYEKAKNIVQDIVLSFNRELNREAEKIEAIAFKIEGNLGKADSTSKKIEAVEKRIAPIETQVKTITQAISQSSTSLLSGITGLETKIRDIEATHETIMVKLTGFEEQLQKVTVTPEVKAEPPMPVIPIKRDKAMAALTDTEIAVLEMLSAEGPKTAPEIKERVHLSREHTARLMKKLYEEGYLEREVGKIPFSYSIKKEMEKLLKKSENPTPIS